MCVCVRACVCGSVRERVCVCVCVFISLSKKLYSWVLNGDLKSTEEAAVYNLGRKCQTLQMSVVKVWHFGCQYHYLGHSRVSPSAGY